jgi:hypothetical protein
MKEECGANEMVLTVVWTHGFKHEVVIQKRRLQVELKRYSENAYIKHVKDGKKILKYEDKGLRY